MNDPSEIAHVWPLGGIEDLPVGWADLAVASMRDVEVRWKARHLELQGTQVLHEFTIRLQREWAIETGQIENLYDIERGVTETLIAQGFDAALMRHGSVNRDPAEILALIEDQRDALEGLFSFVKQDRKLTTGYVKELHAAMCRSQTSTEALDPMGKRVETELLRGEYKKLPNYPRRNGTVYQYCPPEQTASEMERLISMHEQHVRLGAPPEVEAAWLHHRFTQIHPFQDGNGRVARALATLVLIRAGLFPMVVDRDDKTVYLESLERADAGDLSSLVLLIARLQQRRFRDAMSLLAKLAPLDEAATEHANGSGTQ